MDILSISLIAMQCSMSIVAAMIIIVICTIVSFLKSDAITNVNKK